MVHADCIWFRLCNVVKCPLFLIGVQSKTVTVISVNLIWMLIISEGYCLRGKNLWFAIKVIINKLLDAAKEPFVHVILFLMIPYNTIEFEESTKISCVCGFIYTSMRENARGQHYINLNDASFIFTCEIF
jgi:hypothetical protein